MRCEFTRQNMKCANLVEKVEIYGAELLRLSWLY